jgi:hypothetical protein
LLIVWVIRDDFVDYNLFTTTSSCCQYYLFIKFLILFILLSMHAKFAIKLLHHAK